MITMADEVTHARIYPPLNLDTLAFVIYIDILTGGDDHGEFDIYNEDYDTRAAALTDDIMDLIHNANQYDWLIYFASAEDLMHHEIGGNLTFKLDALLGLTGDLDDAGNKLDWNDYDKQVDELAQRVATMMDHKGLSHSFSGFGPA